MESFESQSTADLKASRVSRVGARAGRTVKILRVVRLARLAAALKQFKNCKKCMKRMKQRVTKSEEEDQGKPLTQDLLGRSKVQRIGSQFAEVTTKKVIVLILAMLISLQLLDQSQTLADESISELSATEAIHNYAVDAAANPLFAPGLNATIASVIQRGQGAQKDFSIVNISLDQELIYGWGQTLELRPSEILNYTLELNETVTTVVFNQKVHTLAK